VFAQNPAKVTVVTAACAVALPDSGSDIWFPYQREIRLSG